MTSITLLPAEVLSLEELRLFFEECLRLGSETNLLPAKMYETADSKKAALLNPVQLNELRDRVRIVQKFIPQQKFPFNIVSSLWSDEAEKAFNLKHGTVLRIFSNRYGYCFVHSIAIQFPSLPEYQEYFDQFITELRSLFPYDIVARENATGENTESTANSRKVSIRNREWISETENKARYDKVYWLVHIKH